MKKLLLILLLLPFIAKSQYVVPQGFFYYDTRQIEYKAPGGYVLYDTAAMFKASDTSMKPLYPTIKFFTDNTPVYWDMTKWNAFGSGGTETWQQTLINGSDLTQDNIGNAKGHNFELDSFARFKVHAGDINYVSDASDITLLANASTLFSSTDNANIGAQAGTSSGSHAANFEATAYDSSGNSTDLKLNQDGSMSVKGNLDSSTDTAPNLIGIAADGNWHKYSNLISRFGIEDNIGIQNRAIDMQGFNIFINNSSYIDLIGGDNTSGDFGELYTDNSPRANIYAGDGGTFFSILDANKTNVNIQTNLPSAPSTIQDFFLQFNNSGSGIAELGVIGLDSNSNPTKRGISLGESSLSFNFRDGGGTINNLLFPTIPGNSINYYAPYSVNGNFADNTGNITLGAFGTWNEILANDSTDIVTGDWDNTIHNNVNVFMTVAAGSDDDWDWQQYDYIHIQDAQYLDLTGHVEINIGNGSTYSIDNSTYLNTWFVKSPKGVIVDDGVSSSHDNSAILELTSTTQGFIAPKMTTAERNAISTPAAGLIVFCTDCTATDTSTGVNQTYNGTTWKNWW